MEKKMQEHKTYFQPTIKFIRIISSLLVLMVAAAFILNYVGQFEWRNYDMPYETKLELKIEWGPCAICPADPPNRLQARLERHGIVSDWFELDQWKEPNFETRWSFYTRFAAQDSLALIQFNGFINLPELYNDVHEAAMFLDAHTLKLAYLDQVPDGFCLANEFLAPY